MSHIPRPRRRAKPDFSLAMVNIVFLLLLFYLATGSLIKRDELEAEIPITQDLPLERLPRPLLLIAQEGFFIDGKAVSRAKMAAKARQALESRPGAAFLNVLAARTMPAGAFLDIVAGMQAAGIPVRVVTLHHRSQSEAASP